MVLGWGWGNMSWRKRGGGDQTDWASGDPGLVVLYPPAKPEILRTGGDEGQVPGSNNILSPNSESGFLIAPPPSPKDLSKPLQWGTDFLHLCDVIIPHPSYSLNHTQGGPWVQDMEPHKGKTN